jgi:hypothetical protein
MRACQHARARHTRTWCASVQYCRAVHLVAACVFVSRCRCVSAFHHLCRCSVACTAPGGGRVREGTYVCVSPVLHPHAVTVRFTCSLRTFCADAPAQSVIALETGCIGCSLPCRWAPVMFPAISAGIYAADVRVRDGCNIKAAPSTVGQQLTSCLGPATQRRSCTCTCDCQTKRAAPDCRSASCPGSATACGSAAWRRSRRAAAWKLRCSSCTSPTWKLP